MAPTVGRALWHRLEHALGWTTGRVETWWVYGVDDEPRLWVGFRCTHCGHLGGVHRSPRWIDGSAASSSSLPTP